MKIKMQIETNRKEYLAQAIYLKGAADALSTLNPEFSKELQDASQRLHNAGSQICAQGYFGCYSGEDCTADHK